MSESGLPRQAGDLHWLQGGIVGDTVTGRCTSFFGWYALMQAVHLLSRLVGGEAGGRPFDLQIGLPVDATSSMNSVSVDYVARWRWRMAGLSGRSQDDVMAAAKTW